MIEPLDRNENSEIKLADPAKVLNTVLLFLPFVLILFAVWSVWNTKQSLSSPWLPEYTAYYMNGALINFAVIQSGGIIPALFLRWRKQYMLSSSCIILFIIAAMTLKQTLNFYPHFYGFG